MSEGKELGDMSPIRKGDSIELVDTHTPQAKRRKRF
jgi:hypothetical protein